MCKTNMKVDLYYANICKHEHEKNMTRLWCKIMPHTNVEHIEGNEGSYSYFIPLWGPNSKKFIRKLLYVHQVKNFLKNLFN
jgi:hypothetical protein